MRSSAWQTIPFCIDALLKIRPRRVLDVGVGFGRWGMLVREFCEVWWQASGQPDGKVHLEGLDVAAACVGPHHEQFYDRLHVGDARVLVPTLPGPWDAMICGHVLEHLLRDAGLTLLKQAVARADYVLVNVALGAAHPQADPAEGPHAQRASIWGASDFAELPVVRQACFSDYAGRPLGSFILSRDDPRDLRTGLYSADPAYVDQAVFPGLSYELDELLGAVGDTAAELQYIKGHSTYRLARKLRQSGLWNALRWLQNRNRRIVQVHAPATANPAAQGTEVWLVWAGPNAGEPPIPWDFIECGPGWRQQFEKRRPFAHCLVSQKGGTLRVPGDRDPELRFMAHPFSGHVAVTYQGRTETIDLYSPESGEVAVFPARTPMVAERARAVGGPAHVAAPPRTAADEAFLKKVADERAPVVAIHCPRWLGVTHATRTLFTHTYAVPESPEEEPYLFDAGRLERYVDVLCASGVKHFVFSGGDEMHFALMQRLKERRPEVRCDLLWHGGYLFFNKEYDWRVLCMWLDAARDGQVAVVGTVKKGMEEFFTGVGLRSRLILNYVPGEPREAPTVADDGWHVGIWLSDQMWKVPHAMLAALKLVPGARLHAAGLTKRAEEVARYFDVPIEVFHPGRLPQATLHEEIRRTHLTLYVTFTECCPMLPLESLHEGVPCLIGPASHLFEDAPYLRERLVVPYPERAEVIARYMRRALEERSEIMAACRQYIATYNAAARQSVADFLAPLDHHRGTEAQR